MAENHDPQVNGIQEGVFKKHVTILLVGEAEFIYIISGLLMIGKWAFG